MRCISLRLLYPYHTNNFHVVIYTIIFEFGSVAQSVEQRPEKPCVGGSIPPRATLDLSTTNPFDRGVFYLFKKLGEKWGNFIFSAGFNAEG